MGDRFNMEIWVGGDPGQHLLKLLKFIDDNDLPNDQEPDVSPHLHFFCYDVSGDHLDDFKELLQELNLPYEHHIEGKWDIDSNLYVWHPGMESEDMVLATQNGEPVISIEQLEWELTKNSLITLQEVIAKWKPPELPTFACDDITTAHEPDNTTEPEPSAVIVTVSDDAPTPITKKTLLTLLREEFQDEFEFGGKTWWREDLAQQFELTPEQLFDRDHDTGLLFELKEDGELSADWRQRRDGSYDYLVSLKGQRIEWE